MGVIYLNGIAYGKGSGSGGGGGTSDYNELTHKPTINGSPVSGEIADDILTLVEPLTSQDVQDIDNLIDND